MPLPDAEVFIERAVDETELDDFGTGAWRDGLDALLDALGDAELNGLGEATYEFTIGNGLRSRLGVVDWMRRDPGIRDEVIEAPVVVLGLPRTGTTALAHLLAADRDTRSLRTWEATMPVPPPDRATEATDARIAATQAGIEMSHQLMPDLPRLYFASATSPSEALDLMGMSFRAWQSSGPARIPAYEDWLFACDMHDGYAFEADVLRLLQRHCPPTRWAWKNPPDVACIDVVRTAFPDARFVWTHRDPMAALTSVCSLLSVVAAPGTDSFDPTWLGPRQTEDWATMVDRGLAARAALGEACFVDVFMTDVVADPIAAVAALYDDLDWPFTADAEAAMREWSAGNAQHGRGGHAPDPGDYGLDPDAVAERFSAYTEGFGARGGWT